MIQDSISHDVQITEIVSWNAHIPGVGINSGPEDQGQGTQRKR